MLASWRQCASLRFLQSSQPHLQLFSVAGSVAIVDLLAAEGGEVGAATHMGDTPLQLAARAGHERLIARLLHPPLGTPQLGEAHVHAADRLGWTALHCACQHGSLPVVSLLLQVLCRPPCMLQPTVVACIHALLSSWLLACGAASAVVAMAWLDSSLD